MSDPNAATTIIRPLLADVLDPAALATEIADANVTRRTHPSLPLSIYTYGRACQYENHWTPITTRCRGLVVDDSTGRIAAWCLPKFFNHGQHGKGHDFALPLPDEPFKVYDKVDDSLAIVFHHSGAWRVASKGSFISEQRSATSGGTWESSSTRRPPPCRSPTPASSWRTPAAACAASASTTCGSCSTTIPAAST